MAISITLLSIKDISKTYKLIKVYQNKCKEEDIISKEDHNKVIAFNSNRHKTILMLFLH